MAVKSNEPFRIKGVAKHGDYTYRFTVSVGFDGNGKHIRHTMTYKVPEGTSDSKAEKLVMDAYTNFYKRCKGVQTLDENMKFKELVEIYINQFAKNRLKPSTEYNYRRALDLHMLPVFGNKKLKDITTPVLTQYFTSLDKAPLTTQKLKTIMSAVFTYGVKQGYIQHNPCKGAICKSNVIETEKIKYLDKDQCKQLMSITSEYSTFNTLVQFLLFTGCRIGEALGLTWGSIDFSNNIITIDKNLCFANDVWYLSTPKTKNSFRVIKFGGHIRKLLLKHKAEQDKLKAVVGDAWVHPHIVFTSAIGNYYDRSFVNKQLKKVLSANNLPPISAHGLRHTNASLMINNGFDVKAISEHLGHCNTAITSDIYTHIFKEYKAKMAESIEKDLI